MQQLALILRNILKKSNYREDVIEYDIASLYPTLFPGLISKMSKPIRLEGEVLFVKVFDCVLRTELKFQERTMIEKINKKITQRKIKSIKFL